MTAETAAASDIESDEIEEILQSTNRTVTIGGVECRIRRLKTREFFALMRVLSGGLGRGLEAVITSGDPEEVAGRLAGALLIAIPQAENVFMNFMKLVIEPIDSGADDITEALNNPGLDELLDVIEVMVEQESGELARLGKAARSWWEVQGPMIRSELNQ